jgi:putative DNA primase/helicase
VGAVTDSYFTDQDTFGQWLDECTVNAGPHAFTGVADLFSSWKAWCEVRNHKLGSAMALSEMLAGRNFIKKRKPHTGHRGFVSLTVKQGEGGRCIPA